MDFLVSKYGKLLMVLVIGAFLLIFFACENPSSSSDSPEDSPDNNEEAEEEDEEEESLTLRITYFGNGAVLGEAPADTNEYIRGQTIKIKTQGALRGAPIRDGITQCVTHWNTRADGTGDNYIPGNRNVQGEWYSMPEADLKLYAQWSTGDEVIGKTGPSGGWIFYADSAGTHDGWTYLEAAPSDIVIDGSDQWQWGAEGYDITALDDENIHDAPEAGIGLGWKNTTEIVDTHNKLTTNDEDETPYYEYTGDFGADEAFKNDAGDPQTFVTANDGTVAAKLCTEYTVESGGTSYEDWFHPSEAELLEMYTVLHSSESEFADYPRGGFEESRNYWSTNGYSDSRAKARGFVFDPDNTSDVADIKSNTNRVRPVRRF